MKDLPSHAVFNITCQECGKDCEIYEQVNTAHTGQKLEWWCYCEDCKIESFHSCITNEQN